MNRWQKILVAVLALGVLAAGATAVAFAQGPDKWFPGWGMMGAQGGMGGRGGFGLMPDQTTHLKIMAEALNMSEADLQKALSEGKTLQQIAQEKGLDWDTVHEKMEEAMLTAQKEQLAALVKSGKLTQAQADEWLQRMEDRHEQMDEAQKSGNFPMMFNRGFNTDHFTIIAGVLGMSVDDLQKAFTDGKTLQQIVQDKGLDWKTTATTIENKLYEAQKTQVQEQLSSGKLTQAQADQLLQKLQTRHEAALKAIESGQYMQGWGNGFGGPDGMRHGGGMWGTRNQSGPNL